MQPRLLPVFLLLATSFAPLAMGAGAEHAWVEASLDVVQPDLRNLSITTSVDIHEILVDGQLQTAKQLSDSYRTADAAGKAAVVQRIAAATQSQFEASLAASFPSGSRSVTAPVVDEASLATPHAADLTPPVGVAIAAQVTRSAADVGLGTYSQAAVAALFSAGGEVVSTLTLSAQPGYETSYVIHAPSSPAGLSFASATVGTVSADGTSLAAKLLNRDGADAATSVGTVLVRDASAHAPSAESIETLVDIQLGALRAGVPSIPVASSITASIQAADAQKRFADALPSNVRLTYLSADAIRALHQTGAIGDDQLARASAAMLGGIRDDLTASLGPDTRVAGDFVEGDLHRAASRPFGAGPPLRYVAESTSNHTFAGAGAENADLALRVGAVVKFDVGLSASAERASTFVLHAPPGALFTAASGAGAQVATDGQTATFHTPAGTAGSVPVHLLMRAADAPTYTAQKADLGVLVDLKDLQVTVGKAVKGDFGNLDVDVTVTGNLHVVEVPTDIKEGFSDNLQLSYLDADGLRLLKERGILSAANITKLEDSLRAKIAANLKQALGSDADVTAAIDPASLDAALVGATLSGDKPVTFTAHSTFSKPLSGASSSDAAIALYTVTQSFSLPKVESLDTTYTVVMPSGLALKSVDVAGGSHTQGTSPDGRDQFTVTPSGSAATASVAIAVTPTFVLAKFWPVLLLAVIVLVLVVGTPIALLVVRRRRAK